MGTSVALARITPTLKSRNISAIAQLRLKPRRFCSNRTGMFRIKAITPQDEGRNNTFEGAVKTTEDPEVQHDHRKDEAEHKGAG